MSEDFINLEKKPGNKKSVIVSIIVLLLVFLFVFGFVTLREHNLRETFSSATQRVTEEVSQIFSGEDAEEDAEWTALENEEEDDNEEEEKREYYRKTAKKGDGLTHLAREALTSYMEEEGLDLSDEERVYIEDYVQKRLSPEKSEPRFLDIGEEVEISVELIEEGITQAEELTPEQTENLQQYSAQVVF